MIKIKVGNPVEVKEICNQYELRIVSEHGDADATTHQTIFYLPQNLDEMKSDLLILEAVKEYDHCGYDSQLKKLIANLCEKYGYDDRKLSNRIADLIGYDKVYDHGFASLDGYDIYFWSPSGKKYHVEVEKEDKILFTCQPE